MKNGIRASELQSIEHNKEFYLNQIVEIEFELRWYNGGAGFSEVLDSAIRRMNE